jgi:nucleotide-binding universal stress UspA family protein
MLSKKGWGITGHDSLLLKSNLNHFVSIGALDAAATREADELVGLFAKQGVSAELKTVQSRDSAPNALGHAASELDASLVVMGAYGRWRLRQLVLGNYTENALRCIERPVLLMH